MAWKLRGSRLREANTLHHKWVNNTKVVVNVPLNLRRGDPRFCKDGEKHRFIHMPRRGDSYDIVCQKCSLNIGIFPSRSDSGMKNKHGCQWKPPQNP